MFFAVLTKMLLLGQIALVVVVSAYDLRCDLTGLGSGSVSIEYTLRIRLTMVRQQSSWSDKTVEMKKKKRETNKFRCAFKLVSLFSLDCFITPIKLLLLSDVKYHDDKSRQATKNTKKLTSIRPPYPLHAVAMKRHSRQLTERLAYIKVA